MNDDDMHDMMDRAHNAEIREARLRIEVDRLKAELDKARDLYAAVIQDCRTLCYALLRIEVGEAEPRMIARRTLEHWSEKSALENTSHE